ncbi:hypothetical protein TNIN_34511 [Trichonephila inaurata madagascariensis]|uniref:Uncharacterized protein n=1 Tax=Trichonephila inaurata madagascariensis TaxID=2747483 RepID=A0A8X6YW80_9ARAC|nr:hypothetical protein TNIN_34511 [Trichonephila inaurata madagascariensis]
MKSPETKRVTFHILATSLLKPRILRPLLRHSIVFHGYFAMVGNPALLLSIPTWKHASTSGAAIPNQAFSLSLFLGITWHLITCLESKLAASIG